LFLGATGLNRRLTPKKKRKQLKERGKYMSVNLFVELGQYMKGTCIEDFEERIIRVIFIFRKEEINGWWRIIA